MTMPDAPAGSAPSVSPDMPSGGGGLASCALRFAQDVAVDYVSGAVCMTLGGCGRAVAAAPGAEPGAQRNDTGAVILNTTAGVISLLPIVGIARAAFVRAAAGGAAAGFADDVAWGMAGRCFAGDTEVLTRDGPRPISEVEVGDEVWSFDAELHEWRWMRVTATFVHDYEGPVYTLGLDGSEIHVTGNHPICIAAGLKLSSRPHTNDIGPDPLDCGGNGRWVEASDVMVGDVAIGANGPTMVVEISSFGSSLRVYNIQVDGAHTYAVGASGLLVHNKSAMRPGPYLRGSAAGPRLHGQIPTSGQLRRMGTEELVELGEMTEISLATRGREMQALGDLGRHGSRIGEERQLLKLIEELLKSR